MQKKRSVVMQEWLKSQEVGYKNEIIGVALCVVYLFLILSVVSYRPDDQTIFHFSSATSVVANWAGTVGATVAALLFYMMGCASYFFVLCLLFPLVLLFAHVPLRREWLRLVSLVGAVVTVSMLCSLYDASFIYGVQGGLIGAGSAQALSSAFGVVGVQLLAWASLWMLCAHVLHLGLGRLFCQLCRLGYQQVLSAIKSTWSKVRGLFKRTEKKESVLANEGATKVADESDFWKTVLVQEDGPAEQKDAGEQQNVAEPDGNEFVLPDKSLFMQREKVADDQNKDGQLNDRAKKVEEKLHHFGVKGSIVSIKPGPVVTMFEYKPDIDSKISKIVSLEDDLAMALTAHSIRILAPIPGKEAVGFEIANDGRRDVFMADIVAHKMFEQTSARLPIILGVDIAGNPVIADMASMPHLLVGGSTGSGKSVGLNVMLVSLLCKHSPENLKLILVDPKRLEFTPYADIPHLLFPIVTNPAKAVVVLAWVVQEMERRYEVMSSAGVRSFAEYNQNFREGGILRDAANAAPQDERRGDGLSSNNAREVAGGNGLPNDNPLPYIVVIIDELADLMMVAGKEVEGHIVRIAQMARAAGIHMIVATQRPSVDVVTGLIKVNFPSRIAFRVSSKVDSRTILDSQGAEKLLGRGDMLFMHASSPELKRIHGAYVSDREVESIADFLRMQKSADYLDLNEVLVRNQSNDGQDFDDELYNQIRETVKTMDEVSISSLQRQYRIGFNRSARLIEKLELDGILAPAVGGKPRRVIR